MSAEHVHTLYRFFDKTDRLLYVGRTVDARARWRSHERSKAWFDHVAKVTREIYPDAETLDAAERLAITTESPLHNIALNPRPKLRVAGKLAWASDELFIHRLLSLSGSATQIEPEPSCGDACVEHHCECFDCHRERVAYLEHVEEDYLIDPTMTRRCTTLRASYADARLPLGMWLDELFDLTLFRPLEIRIFSKSDPIPAQAQVHDGVLTVWCPFCSGTHDHFFTSGAAIGRLSAPCDVEAQYLPVFDDHDERESEWYEREARQWSAVA